MRLPMAAWRPCTLLVLSGALAGAVGCGGDDDKDGTTAPTGSVVGRYVVVQVNDDDTAPFTVFEGAENGDTVRVELVEGSVDLANDGTYTRLATTRLTFNSNAPQTVPVVETGRYTTSGNGVTFDPSGDDSDDPNYTATRDGDTLTVTQHDADFGTVTIVARRS